jgi:cytoplasmic iron level regulating protein YaaA (DUF328/UPF0246 family)
VLILLPASDAKQPVFLGEPFDASGLSFSELAPMRATVLDALLEVSAQPDATRQLSEPASLDDLVRDNLAIPDAPTAKAEAVYSGVLYEALGLADLDAASRRRARAWIVVISALWGALRLDDRIPSYRLNMCGRLPGLGHLPDVWRRPLSEVLPDAARRGVVVDGRSAEYATAWRPTGELAERTVILKVVKDLEGRRGAAGHSAKATRGLVVRRIVTDAIDPDHPEELADALSAHFELDLHQLDRLGRSWELLVVEPTA